MTLPKVCKSLVFLMLLAAIPATAALTNLPEGSLVSGTSRTLYTMANNKAIDLKVEFAVYDTEADGFSELGLNTPGDGRYLYTYQLFCGSVENYGLIDAAMQMFRLVDSAQANTIGFDADSDGVDPTDSYFDFYTEEPTWEFNGTLTPGANSAILTLSSDNEWTRGYYDLVPSDYGTGQDTGTGTDTDDDSAQTPEPATLMLLAAGGIAVLRRKKS
jgi:hypothetical protein